eukprot:Hpha_TRINITY_DN14467_c0_g1::TRINITY_DN14467_c0_g1_i1::g.158101::m.158101
MLLDLRETKQLVGVLQMGGRSFAQIEEVLQGLHRSADGGGRLCLALRCMMMDNYYRAADAEYHVELVVTAFVLWSLSNASQTPLPSTKSVLFLMLQQIEGEIRERHSSREDATTLRQKTALKVFILTCMADQMRGDLLQKTPYQWLAMEVPFLQEEHARLQQQCRRQLVQALDEAKKAHEDEQKLSSGGFLSRGVTPLLVLPDSTSDGASSDWTQEALQSREMRFDPVCDRPRPPPLALTEGELSFIYNQGLPTDLMWDETMGSTPDEVLELRETVNKAHSVHLTTEEERTVLDRLSSTPELVLRVGFTPQCFPDIVERNPQIAGAVIRLLCELNYRSAEDFLTVVINMDVCITVCECLLGLLDPPVPQLLPGGDGQRFITEFLSQGIASCSSAAKKPGGSTSRSERFIATMAKKILHSRQAQLSPLLDPVREELKQFCVEFASVSEVNLLYRELTDQ